MNLKELAPPEIFLKLSAVTIIGVGITQTILMTPTSLSITKNFVSEYIYTPLAWVLITSLVLFGLTAFLQAHVLFYFIDKKSGVYMILWGASMIPTSIFPTDKGGYATTTHGLIHLTSFLAGLIMLTLALARLKQIDGYEMTRYLFITTIICFALFFISPALNLAGVFERLLILSMIIDHGILAYLIDHQLE